MHTFICVFLTAVTQRGSKIEVMWLEEQGGTELFIMSDQKRVFVLIEKKWEDGKWSSNENLVSIMYLGRQGSDWQSPGDAPISNIRDKVSEGKGQVRKRLVALTRHRLVAEFSGWIQELMPCTWNQG